MWQIPMVSNKRCTLPADCPEGTGVVVGCTDLSGKEPHRQTDRCGDWVLTSGSLGGVMLRTLVQNARDVGSIPAPGALFAIFIMYMR